MSRLAIAITKAHRSKHKSTLSASALAVILAAGSSSAAAQERIEFDGHQHGSALVQIALEHNQISATLRSPSANFLGFEHAPESAEEKAAMAALETSFSQDFGLLSFNSEAQCSVQQISLAQALETADEHDDHDEAHGHDDHDEEHGHDDHDEEHGRDDHDKEHGHDDHDKEHDHKEGEVHSEIVVHWRFNCSEPNALSTIKTTVFNKYQGLEQLEVQFISERVQHGASLNAKQPSTSF
ncbi:MAG: ZrgA family zinc uptake protein [Pseudomonadales bacterium]